MADQVQFARKYRPTRLNQYIGNENIVAAVHNMLLLTEDRPQIILLHGYSGCGKTTLARLLCASYCCTNPNEKGEPCGTCEYCQRFDAYIQSGDFGDLMNVHEIDSATFGGKADVERITEEMALPTYDDSWRCYIFDECHRLTPQAQSALLKTVEEPPEKVLICLCTTEPDKILPTLISRCQRNFKIKKPKRLDLINLLISVCTAEKIKYDNKALSVIATSAQLTPRNALNTLQAVYNNCGEVTYEKTVADLNVVVDKYYFTFYNLLLQPVIETYRYISFIYELKDTMSLSDFISGLIEFTIRGVYIYNGIAVDGLDQSELKPYSQLFARFTPEQLVFTLSTLASMRDDKDLECRLLLLGFEGLTNKHRGTDIAEAPSLDAIKTSAQSDTMAAVNAVQERNSTTPEQQQKLIKEHTAPVDMSEILNMFNGVKVEV